MLGDMRCVVNTMLVFDAEDCVWVVRVVSLLVMESLRMRSPDWRRIVTVRRLRLDVRSASGFRVRPAGKTRSSSRTCSVMQKISNTGMNSLTSKTPPTLRTRAHSFTMRQRSAAWLK